MIDEVTLEVREVEDLAAKHAGLELLDEDGKIDLDEQSPERAAGLFMVHRRGDVEERAVGPDHPPRFPFQSDLGERDRASPLLERIGRAGSLHWAPLALRQRQYVSFASVDVDQVVARAGCRHVADAHIGRPPVENLGEDLLEATSP